MTRHTFTTITPLPSSITRQVVIDFLHDHLEMIDLNPLIKERHPIPPPPHASAEEQRCVWYSLTDRIDYLPGGVVSGQVSYTCAFYDLPEGLQTHCYAPMGLDIRDRWSIGGSMPGEPPQPVELGLGAPMTGLYLREDVDLRCNMLMAGFVKKTLKKSHGSLVDKLAAKAQIVSANQSTQSVRTDSPGSLQSPTPTGSESSGMAPLGPLLPPGIGPGQHVTGSNLAYESHSRSSSVGDYYQQRNGTLSPPVHPLGMGSDQPGLGYPNTAYHSNSNSNSQDHFGFPTQNPYSSQDQRQSELNDTKQDHYPYQQYEKS
ncbi:hypothetical protein N0V84_001744 [Fusarium piperis]|uniref:DUF7053 domain-containing protein n=1 Tax=Fusarium piperis TaxID=1435070 RepID=A0A9W9BS96_9HYPO|nr:hypothetical protein N0V84_001744 [Fusarium piperis]